MEKRQVCAMLVDDLEAQRNQLARELQSLSVKVVTVGDPREALKIVESNRQDFDFLLIDYHFSVAKPRTVLDIQNGSRPISSGLDLCEQVARLNPAIPIIVYTTKDSPLDANEAVAKGAYRVIDRAAVTGLVDELQSNMEELRSISGRMAEILDSRRAMSHVIAGLNVGFQIVDRHGKVWFRDEAYRRIMGESGRPFDICYCRSHGYSLDHGSCANCQIPRVIETGKEQFGVFYSPTYPNGPGTNPIFQYLTVTSSPVFAVSGKGGPNHKAIAALETVARAATGYVESLGLRDHLDVLAKGLENMGFRRIRIYRTTGSPAGGGQAIVGLVSRGPLPDGTVFTDMRIPVRMLPAPDGKQATRLATQQEYLDVTEEIRRKLGIVPLHDPLWVALFDASGDLVGWVGLDNGLLDQKGRSLYRPASVSDLYPERDRESIPPSPLELMREIARVLASKPLAGDAPAPAVAMAETIYEKIRMRVASDVGASPSRVFECVLNAVQQEVPELTMAHIRRIEGDWAISVASMGKYQEIADERIQIRSSHRTVARVASSGRAGFLDDLAGDPECDSGLDELTEAQKQVIRTLKSHAVYPILAEGRPVGTVTFRAPEAGFFVPWRRHLFRLVADLLAKALDDYIVCERERRMQALEIGARAACLVLHNVNQPLGTIRNQIMLMETQLKRPSIDRPSMEKRLSTIDRQCIRIAQIREDFLSLFRQSPSELVVVDVHGVIQSIAQAITSQGEAIELGFDLAKSLKRVRTERNCLAVVLRVLIENAADALRESMGRKLLSIILRSPTAESVHEPSLGLGCMAIDVIDNGPGMPADVRQHLFEPFHSTKQDGLGIGLAYSRWMAQAAGGDIRHFGDDPRGTRFTFYLRAESVDEPSIDHGEDNENTIC